jgi:hypothetical protein
MWLDRCPVLVDHYSQFIGLGDFDDVRNQVAKLKQTDPQGLLISIIQKLDQQQFHHAIEDIIEYVSRLKALTLYRNPDLEKLKRQLLTLELQINALSDQKSDIERIINDFLHQHHQRLGALIRQFLMLRRIFAKQRVDELLDEAGDDVESLNSDEIDQAKDDYVEAQEDYEEYTEQFDELEEETSPTKLTEEQQIELKRLYRKASMLCHPDRVNENQKTEAHTIFLQLQAAYRNHDLVGLRALLERLQKGKFFTDQSAVLDEAEQLQQVIVELQTKLSQLRKQLNGLMNSETWQTITQIVGDWDTYFDDKESQLEIEISELESQVSG